MFCYWFNRHKTDPNRFNKMQTLHQRRGKNSASRDQVSCGFRLFIAGRNFNGIMSKIKILLFQTWYSFFLWRPKKFCRRFFLSIQQNSTVTKSCQAPKEREKACLEASCLNMCLYKWDLSVTTIPKLKVHKWATLTFIYFCAITNDR